MNETLPACPECQWKWVSWGYDDRGKGAYVCQHCGLGIAKSAMLFLESVGGDAWRTLRATDIARYQEIVEGKREA